MANHFSSIGFRVGNRQELEKLVLDARKHGSRTVTPHGEYFCWEVGAGAEMWVGFDDQGKFASLSPHFAGAAAMRVAVVERQSSPDSLLEGCAHGWADPRDDGSEKGAYPFMFSVPDFDVLSRIGLPAVRAIRLAAFAHELSLFANDREFASAPGSVRVADESFIPMGLFTVSSERNEPKPMAAFTGHILEKEHLSNSVSGQQFWRFEIRTYGGIVNVVADSDMVEGEPIVGGIMQGLFWLSGRVLE